MKEQSYTFTPSMGRTVCTEPQCLYKGDLYLFNFLQSRRRFREITEKYDGGGMCMYVHTVERKKYRIIILHIQHGV
jgi:hypothetical protein